MMKIVYKRIIYLILIIAWMITIFCFSNQDGDASQGTSDMVTDRIVDILQNISKIEIANEEKEIVSFIVRKTAHFSIYFLGGILIFNFLNTFSIKKKYMIILTIIFGVFYSVLDEMHQYFVSGRSAQFKDVCIDTSGVILATIIKYIICIKNNIRKETK